MDLSFLEGLSNSYELVGSRVTCDPPPVDTDQDVLVLTDELLWRGYMSPYLEQTGFIVGGSDCGDQALYLASNDMTFQSFTHGELNLIVTFSQQFYDRFVAATAVAKALNLLEKVDRIMLFQAVLYGNAPAPEVPPPLPFDLPPIADYVRPWWLTTEKGHHGCVEALNETEARAITAKAWGAEPDTCQKLPYPANPRINEYAGNPYGVCPSFCYNPGLCKGRSSCPQSPSCVD